VKTFFIISLFALLSISFKQNGYSQWQPVSIPQGQNGANFIVSAGARVLTPGPGGGFYVTTDGGASWQLKQSGIAPKHLNALVSDGNTVFVAYSDSTIYRSQDGGDSWTQMSTSGIHPFDKMVAIAAVPGALFISEESNPVFRSTDDGVSWMRIDSPQHHLPFNNIANGLNGVTSVGGRLISPSYSQILISSDNGLTWDTSKIKFSLGFGVVANIGDTVLVGGASGLAHSTDGGLTWTEDENLNNVYSVAAMGNNFYAIDLNGGVYRSGDGGFSWTPWDRGLPDLQITNIVASGQGLVAAGRGFWRLPEDQGRWEWAGNGMQPQTVLCFDTTENAMCAGTQWWDFISWDEGVTWQPVQFGYPASYFIVNKDTLGVIGWSTRILPATSSDTSYVLWWIYNSTFVGGFPIPNFLTIGSTIVAVNPFDYLGSESAGLYGFGRNVGSSADTNGLPARSERAVEAIGWNGKYLFVATRFDGMYRSADTGKHLSKFSTGFPDNTFTSDTSYLNLYINSGWRTGAIACMGRTVFVATPHGVFRSTDDGATWTTISQGLPSRPIRNIKAFSFGLLASADSGDIYFSPDNGNTWYDKSDGLAPATVYAFQQFGGYLYISNENGVFRRPIPEVTSGVQVNVLTTSSIDLQFPNPFQNSDQVVFSTITDQTLDMRLYDVLGREVSALAHRNYPAGSYHVALDGLHAASGVYYCILRSVTGQVSKPVIFEK